MEVKIRFNTDKDKINAQLPPWRVIIANKEFLAEKVEIQVNSWTTLDEIEPGKFKWHITCFGQPKWNERECIIQKVE